MKARQSLVTVAAAVLLGACGGGTAPDTGPKLSPAPNCATAAINADTLYTEVLKTSCAASTCHGAGTTVPFKANSGAEFKAAWVGKAASQTSKVPYVTAGDADKSYVMYKVLGQGTKAGGSASQMPLGGAPLAEADICKIYNWIEGGAE